MLDRSRRLSLATLLVFAVVGVVAPPFVATCAEQPEKPKTITVAELRNVTNIVMLTEGILA